MVKKREELKATERWRMNGQNVDFVDKCNYLRSETSVVEHRGLDKTESFACN
jgi:hypothetical protein